VSAPVTPGQGQGLGCPLVLGAAVVSVLTVVVLVAQVVMAVWS
jgi:hypothetical protein